MAGSMVWVICWVVDPACAMGAEAVRSTVEPGATVPAEDVTVMAVDTA